MSGDLFDLFWSLYPRKVAKGAARRAWTAAVRRTTADRIVAVLRVYPFDLSRPKYIPHPATWLNGERYDDDLGAVLPIEGSVWDSVYASLPAAMSGTAPDEKGIVIDGDLFA